MAAIVLLWFGGAVNLLWWGRALLRWRRLRRAGRTNSPQPVSSAMPSARLCNSYVTSDLWQSEAEVLREGRAKLRRIRERLAEYERADALVEPGIRAIEEYLRRAAGPEQNDGA